MGGWFCISPNGRATAGGFWISIAMLLGLVVLGCGSDAPQSGAGAAAIPPSTGVPDTAGPTDPGGPSGWTIQELFRVGSVRGEEGLVAFGQVSGVELDEGGNLYVLDALTKVVHRFGPDGEPLRAMGGLGRGPGEFRDPNGLLITSDGRLWVLDPTGMRYTAFGPGGAVAGTYRRAFSAGWDNSWDAVALEDGTIYEPTTIFAPGSEEIIPVILGLREGHGLMLPVDTFLMPQPLDPATWNVAPSQSASGPIISGWVPVPFSPESRVRLDPRGGYWAGTTGAPKFTRITWNGDTLQVIENVGAELRPITGRDRELAVRDLSDRFGEGLQADLSQVPDLMPYWQEFWVDHLGRLWVERFRPPGTSVVQPHEWEIYGPGGDYLGLLRLPLVGSPVPVLRKDRLAGVVRDELDVDQVVVFELTAGGQGGTAPDER